MGLEIETLSNKETFLDVNDNVIMDLTTPSVSINYVETRLLRFVILEEDMSMRPDVLSKLVYGSEDFIGHLLKYNGISNPLALNAGDIIAVPELVDMSRHVTSTKDSNTESKVRDQFVDPKKARETDSSRSDLDKKLEDIRKRGLASNVSDTNLPPNIAKEGDSEFKIKGGKIFFGSDVTKGTEECSEPISKAELRSRLIKNRLK